MAEIAIVVLEGTTHICGWCGKEIVDAGPWLHREHFFEMKRRPRGRSSSSMRKAAERCRDKGRLAIEARLRLDSYEGTVWVGLRTERALAYRFGRRSDPKLTRRTPWATEISRPTRAS